MADEEKPIKVSDFRMFTPEGELKPEYRDLEEASEPETAAPPPPPPPAESPAPEPGPEPEAAAPGGADPDFVDLVRSLATSAYSALGLLSDPGAGPGAGSDLVGARRMIEWLALLERKTRKNLTFAEQDLLNRALYELRMAYVEASGVATPPPTR
ncbi:MAG TPA: DUF1844 domain-containing protein [Thermoanaerobaculia bacterium]|nr:DUF1844 domain-containing protein [Thermoanaerobaculia bacterium]